MQAMALVGQKGLLKSKKDSCVVLIRRSPSLYDRCDCGGIWEKLPSSATSAEHMADSFFDVRTAKGITWAVCSSLIKASENDLASSPRSFETLPFQAFPHLRWAVAAMQQVKRQSEASPQPEHPVSHQNPPARQFNQTELMPDDLAES